MVHLERVGQRHVFSGERGGVIPPEAGTPLGEVVIGIIAIRQKDHGLDRNQNPDQNPGQNQDLGQDLELKDQNPDQNPDLRTFKKIKKRSSNNKKQGKTRVRKQLY